MLKRIIKLAGLLAVIAFAMPAQADLTYELNIEIGGDDEGATAEVTFTNFADEAGAVVSFDITIEVTSPNGGALTSLAFVVPINVIDMDLLGQASDGGDYIAFALCFDGTIEEGDTDACNSSISPISDPFDACLLTSNSDNCAGGNVNNGLAAGDQATINLSVALDPDLTAAEFEAALKAAIEAGVSTNGGTTVFGICARFQGIGEGIDGYQGEGSDKKCGEGEFEVPEPGTLGLLGLGLLGVGLARRRREFA